MKPRNCLALLVTSVLAIGCASARAQDNPGGPPPAPPQGSPPDGGAEAPRPKPDPAEMKRHMAERLSEFQMQIEEITRDAGPNSEKRLTEMKRRADMLRERMAQIDRGEMPGPMEPQGGEGRRMGRMDGPGPRDGRGPRDGMGRSPEGGPMGPGPSVEQRLEQLERAVREMHAMFERHNVAPEMRERAEREMRERREGGGPPQQGGRPGEMNDPRAPGGPGGPGSGQGGGPDRRPQGAGGPPPEGGDRPQENMDRPAVPRPPMLQFKIPNQELEQMRRAMEDQMRAAHDQIEEVKRALADTQAALKKAQEELEAQRAKK